MGEALDVVEFGHLIPHERRAEGGQPTVVILPTPFPPSLLPSTVMRCLFALFLRESIAETNLCAFLSGVSDGRKWALLLQAKRV